MGGLGLLDYQRAQEPFWLCGAAGILQLRSWEFGAPQAATAGRSATQDADESSND